jgi:hypothetical protein
MMNAQKEYQICLFLSKLFLTGPGRKILHFLTLMKTEFLESMIKINIVYSSFMLKIFIFGWNIVYGNAFVIVPKYNRANKYPIFSMI